ncbi:MAG TPA: TIGR03767 family metallophosphoesterase [Iamia sp.]|nr:TIGR03767 family metallophosphoesterase [Iamia sp.]
MGTIGRRRLLVGGAVAAATWRCGPVPILGATGRMPGRLPLAAVTRPDGTTLARTILRPPGEGYRRLVEGPGQAIVVRDELGPPQPGREDRRRPLAVFVQLSDLHLVDVQSPGRVELLDPLGAPYSGAWRPQEALSTQVASAMVAHLNGLGHGPVTGRPFDALVCTGDNIDNGQVNELEWFVRVLDGGRLTPDSGDLGRYEGVQDDVDRDRRFWHPDEGGTDDWTAAGFPTFDGLLADALAPFETEALAVPWWPAYGNHDGLLQGNAAPHPSFDTILTGDRKIVDLPAGTDPNTFVATLLTEPRAVADRLRTRDYVTREVAADEDRRSITRTDWIDRLLASDAGPHGYVDADRDATKTWYRFPLADGVVGISLDTCAHGGSAGGCITEGQLRWLETELAAVHTTHLGPDGGVVRTGADDQLVVVFSHHTAGTMDADVPDPAFPAERMVGGTELVATLLRYPNVVAWVNGHTHVHEVHVHPHPQGLTPGFWEVTTASHIDFPQQSRVLELVDNADGTHSLFGVVLDHDGPLAADADDRSLAGLVAISRELSANDGQGHSEPFSDPGVFNVELVRPAPFVRGGPVAPPPDLAHTGPSTVPLAGVGLALVAGGAALQAAVRLRERTL